MPTWHQTGFGGRGAKGPCSLPRAHASILYTSGLPCVGHLLGILDMTHNLPLFNVTPRPVHHATPHPFPNGDNVADTPRPGTGSAQRKRVARISWAAGRRRSPVSVVFVPMTLCESACTGSLLRSVRFRSLGPG